MRISIPPNLAGVRLPPISAELTLDRLIAIEAASLAAALGGRVSRDIQGRLQQASTAYLPLAQLEAWGIIAQYDSATLSIDLKIRDEARGIQRFELTTDRSDATSAIAMTPAAFAAGITGTLVASRELRATAGNERISYDFYGFANVGGSEGAYLTYAGAVNLRGGRRTFERGPITVFKDDRDKVLRYASGDLAPQTPPIAGDVELLGLSVERRYNALQPSRNIRPTGRRTFTLERPARIDIFANDTLIQSLNADAGPVDLAEIPGLASTSDISIVVEDSFGRRELDSFSLINDIDLIGEGLSEFSFAAGVLREAAAGTIRYGGRPVALGQYTRGLASGLTVGGHFIAARAVQNAGGSAALLLERGVISGSAAFSRAAGSGEGFAAGIVYRGDPLDRGARGSRLNLRLDYQTRRYRQAGVLAPSANTKLEAAADYRIGLSRTYTVSVGGSFARRYRTSHPSYAVSSGVQASFGGVVVSVNARYARLGRGRSDTGVLGTVTVPLGGRLIMNASGDSAANRARLELRNRRGFELPDLDYSLIAEQAAGAQSLNGRARYREPRFEADVDVASRFQGGEKPQMRGQLRLQTGFGIADGNLGFGRDAGRGFALVRKHPTLEKARVVVDTASSGRGAGRADALGPALIPQGAAYREERLTISVNDAPIGYNIGAGEYVAEPGAATGIVITVGSDAFRSMIVRLRSRFGEPLPLRFGLFRNLADGSTTPFFTNATGRAVFTELRAGRYRAEFPDSNLAFAFEIKADDPAVIMRGDVNMENSQ